MGPAGRPPRGAELRPDALLISFVAAVDGTEDPFAFDSRVRAPVPPPFLSSIHLQMKTILFALSLLLAAAPAAAQTLVDVPTAQGTYELSAVEVMPQVRNAREVQAALAAAYPDSLRFAGIGGVVEVRMRVNEAGVPDSLSVVKSTNPAFDAPTLQVAAVLRFVAAQVGGKPVKVWVEIPIQWATQP